MKVTRRRVGFIGFEGVNALDVVGPLEAFASAGRADCSQKESHGAYELVILGLGEESFVAESGLRMVPDYPLENAPSLDTVIVPGGWGIREPVTNAAVSAWLKKRAAKIRRVATICTGIYALAPTGLLDARRATTHWRFVNDVTERFPLIEMKGDALFLKDGRFYTSGGVTSGIDLALALIQEDFGPRVSLAVARELVMYVKRTGGQDQYSEPLRFQTRSLDTFSDLIAWICAHLDQELSAEILAARVRLSARQFSRRFAAALSCTPIEFVETARLGAARERLTDTRKNIDSIAASVGFRSADVFRRRFQQRFGVSPKRYRELFSATLLRPGGAPLNAPGVS